MAEPWRDSNYAHRKEITVQNANIDGDLTDFPVLIAWDSDTDINTSKVQADLDDIRFYDGSGTLLKFEVNSYIIDGTSSTARVWVKKPTLKTSPAGNDNKIWIYYGNAAATNGEDAANTWEANFVAVWHLEENPDDGFSDSSGNGHSGTKGVAAMTSTDSVAGQVGNAIDLDGVSDHIDFGDDAAFSFGDGSTDSAFSVSFWANLDNNNTQMPIGKYDGGLNEWAIYMFSSSGINFNLVDESTNAQIGKYGTGSMPTNSWHHWGVTYDGSSSSSGIELYKDGASNYGGTDNSGSYTAMENLATKLRIGKRVTDNAWAVNGTIDEMRLSSVERSAAWMKFECFNAKEADNELTWSAEEEESEGPTLTPAVLSAAATVQSPTILSGPVYVASTLSAAATVQSPTIQITGGGPTLTPAVLSAAATVQSPTIALGATIAPAVLSAAATAPAPALAITSDVILSPAVLSAAATVQSPTVSAGSSITVEPAALASSATVQAPGPQVSLSPDVLSAASAALASSQGVQISSGVLSAAAAAQSPVVAILGDVTLTPAALSVSATLQPSGPAVTTSSSAQGAAAVVLAPVVSGSDSDYICPASVLSLSTAVLSPTVAGTQSQQLIQSLYAYESARAVQGVMVEYHTPRGELPVAIEVEVIPARTEYEVESAPGIITTVVSQDWLILASELAELGGPSVGEPLVGDEIHYLSGSYDVISLTGDRHYEHADPWGYILRVHTKLSGDVVSPAVEAAAGPGRAAAIAAYRAARSRAGETITYSRGAAQVHISSLPGRHEHNQEGTGRVTTHWRDWLVLSSELILSSVQVLPELGDLITVGAESYRVVSLSGDRHYRQSDPWGAVLRIHAKQV